MTIKLSVMLTCSYPMHDYGWMARQIEALVDAGATHIAFGPPHGPDFKEPIKLLGEKFLPYFRS